MEPENKPTSNINEIKEENNKMDSIITDINPISSNNNTQSQITTDKSLLKQQILELGFDAEKVDLALQISNDMEEAVNLIVKMMEDNEFFNSLKYDKSLSIENKSFSSGNRPSTPDFEAKNNNINPFDLLDKCNQVDQYKLVILVRKDLKMSIGKISAQVAHGALDAYKISLKKDKNKVKCWEDYSGSAKIVLGVENYDELNKYYNKAKQCGLVCCIIQDAGRTEVSPGTATVCAIGPDINAKIDMVTGELKLL